VRALEVIELTGGPFTAVLPEPRPFYRSLQVGVDLDPAALDERVDLRVDHMWTAGLVDEVRGLPAMGITAGRALGYQQVLRFLAGGWTEEEAKDDTTRAPPRLLPRQR